jgi:hypothetical protein
MWAGVSYKEIHKDEDICRPTPAAPALMLIE